jgi:hypothetical protein
MKKMGILIIALGLILSWCFYGCGIPQSQYDAVNADLSTAKQDLKTTLTQLETIQSELARSQVEAQTAQSQLISTQTELTSSQSKVSQLETDLGKNRTEMLLSQTNLSSLQAKMVGIEKVYPPREFSSSTELLNWLRKNNISERPDSTTAESLYATALELQKDALEAGYIISANVDLEEEETTPFYIACVACINGELWGWDPGTDEAIEFTSAFGWSKVR